MWARRAASIGVRILSSSGLEWRDMLRFVVTLAHPHPAAGVCERRHPPPPSCLTRFRMAVGIRCQLFCCPPGVMPSLVSISRLHLCSMIEIWTVWLEVVAKRRQARLWMQVGGAQFWREARVHQRRHQGMQGQQAAAEPRPARPAGSAPRAPGCRKLSALPRRSRSAGSSPPAGVRPRRHQRGVHEAD